jgi:hypothetical protein
MGLLVSGFTYKACVLIYEMYTILKSLKCRCLKMQGNTSFLLTSLSLVLQINTIGKIDY